MEQQLERRDFKMYCKEIGNDGSEFELVFEIDGKIVDRQTEFSFQNVLIESEDFLVRNCEKYDYDSRFDSFEVSLNYIFS